MTTGMKGTLEGTAEGTTLQFTIDLDTPQGPMQIPCEAEVAGDSIEGSAHDGSSDVPWKGERKK